MLKRSGVLLDSDARKQKFLGLLAQVGRAGLNALFPHDFEFYMCSLELVDSDGFIVENFTFPLTPKAISQKEAKILNIEKSQGGITTTNTTTFEPLDIAISGTFGRRFRILSENAVEDFAAIKGSFNRIKNGEKRGKQTIRRFSKSLLTGYGCYKTLQNLFRKANALDDKGNPYKMFFYNPIFGDNFLVRMVSFDGSQSMENNMMHNYDLKMVALAPAEAVRPSNARIKNLGKMVGNSVTSQAAEAIVGDLVNGLP